MGLLSRKYPWSKWKKHTALLGDAELSPFVPVTEPLSETSYHDLLRQFPALYVKPVYGGGGKGIYKLQHGEEGKVTLKTVDQGWEGTAEEIYAVLRSRTNSRPYLIQQGIDLLTVEGRPVDFRTLLVKPRRSWVYMGIIGKKAVPDQIVTNHCRGGTALTLDAALAQADEPFGKETEELHKEMESLSLRIAETLSKSFPLVAELGLDIGLDRCGKPWLIEANTRPHYKLFREHPDRLLHARIHAMIRKVRVPLKKKNRPSG